MAGGHQVTVPTDLAVLSIAIVANISWSPRRIRVLRRRSRRRAIILAGTARTAERHVTHALVHATHLKFAKLVLEELQVPACVTHLRIETGTNGLIVGLCSHGIRAIDQDLFSLDLLVDILDSLIFIHDRGG